ncbi:HlyD family efflux transporter periplasmic adaptor subunit [uncultured Brevundimonas sp.]|uniref:HlyD family efflux transporter periplasmic adaptor subunit n=1 Tax=uncultured Brevundimonas sp. TaxID=213418 RepID=UPI0025F8D964|nr:HlyD family efflux transporter periplasmic adaptor subunit [uncultured Brevundimonas sp.]
MNLFREEAVENIGSRRLEGEIVLAAPLSIRLLALVCVGVVFGAVIFANLATYARKEAAPGWVVPDAGLIRVVTQQPGVVMNLAVAEGDRVAAGQPLAELRQSVSTAAGDSYDTLTANFTRQDQANEAEAATVLNSLIQERENLASTRSAFQAELGQNIERERLQLERLKLSEEEVERSESIAERGFLPRQQLDGRRAAALSNAQELASIRSSIISLRRQIREIDGRLAGIPNDLRAAQARRDAQSAALETQQNQTEADAAFLPVAPVAGRVSVLAVRRGQSLNAGQTLAVVVPDNATLYVELFVPSRAAGFLKVGQPVRLMYQAFPYQKFGADEGSILAISRTVLAATDVETAGVEVTEPVFRVRVKIPRPYIEAYGQSYALQPGMRVDADIIVDRRTLAEWLFDPLYAAGRR